MPTGPSWTLSCMVGIWHWHIPTFIITDLSPPWWVFVMVGISRQAGVIIISCHHDTLFQIFTQMARVTTSSIHWMLKGQPRNLRRMETYRSQYCFCWRICKRLYKANQEMSGSDVSDLLDLLPDWVRRRPIETDWKNDSSDVGTRVVLPSHWAHN